ncbi:imelysin family protein [Puia sp.]|uniref:imelysin family protein n=1 Tax=Puia sp. TaxID=2045100 RepID=UPI002F4232B6
MKRIWIVCFLAAGILYACSKSNKGGGGGTTTPTGGDEELANIGNNIILPAYASLNVSVNSLDSAIVDFNAGPTADKLTAVQNLFKAAYVRWEAVSAYDYFGPAASNQPVLAGLNLFPTNTVTIEANVGSGNNNVNAFANASAKGFPALDYLLFGAGGNTLAGFASANRKAYLAAVSADIKAEVNAAAKGWSASGGNYIATFLAGTGNSVSSSLGLLINSIVQDFEITKNDRLGIPLGKQPPGQSLPVLPKELEAYYSGISAQLCLAQIKAVQNLYQGIGTAGDGKGLADYVVKANAKYGSGLLNDTLTAKFTSAVNGMSAISDPMSASIQSNSAPANAVYVTTQQLVVLLKTDMASSLGVLITFGDNDGD